MQQLRFITEQIVWQEVPNETALAFLISGCPLGCKGCHSTESWQAGKGIVLTEAYFIHRLSQYQGLVSCVLFMGGEWHEQSLLTLLKQAKRQGLATCLYTGLEKNELSPALLAELTYLKTGRWIAERGGLSSPMTNQQFIDLRTGKNLNHLFIQGN